VFHKPEVTAVTKNSCTQFFKLRFFISYSFTDFDFSRRPKNDLF